MHSQKKSINWEAQGGGGAVSLSLCHCHCHCTPPPPKPQFLWKTSVVKTINGNRYFICTTHIFRIEEDITKDASCTTNGHVVHILCQKIGKVWDMVPLDNLSTYRISATTPFK